MSHYNMNFDNMLAWQSTYVIFFDLDIYNLNQQCKQN